MKRISVLLVEDSALFREALCAVLTEKDDIEVVGEATTGREALGLLQTLHPDVVVMDISMPLLNGLEATRQIHKTFPSTKVLILSAHNDNAYARQAALYGAMGYLTKQMAAEVLCKAIREVHRGGTMFSTDTSTNQHPRVATSSMKSTMPVKTAPELTSREVEVLQLIAEGMPNKQTAAELNISIKTVEKHRDHLMRKIDIHDTAGLTRYAVAAGIIDVHKTIQLSF